MAGKLRVPRSRGAIAGLLLVLLGAWGGLVAFIGPYFHYAFTPDSAWTYTTGRLWLEILPGLGTLIGGLIVLASTLRPLALLGAWMAAVSGAWFAVGSALTPLWANGGGPAQGPGAPVGGTLARAVEQIGFFSGLGVVVVFVAAATLGRLTVLAARDVRNPARGKRVDEVKAVDDVKATTGKLPVRTAIFRHVGSAKTPARDRARQERTEPADISS